MKYQERGEMPDRLSYLNRILPSIVSRHEHPNEDGEENLANATKQYFWNNRPKIHAKIADVKNKLKQTSPVSIYWSIFKLRIIF